jgi:uncharacterized protein YndB with AHSA1/START domain
MTESTSARSESASEAGGHGRAIRLQIQVPGTPEDVWEAVATGPGITSWFVPTTMHESGGRVQSVDMEFFPGSVESGKVAAYDAPRRFVYETDGADGSPALAYEWLVEPREDGTCLVRLVNSGLGADGDGQYNSMHSGWQLFLNNLRLYLTHFPKQACAPILVSGQAGGTLEQAWQALTDALGLDGHQVGETVAATATGAPELSGVVERSMPGMLTLIMDKPGAGIAFLSAESMGEGAVRISAYLYFFGADAQRTAATAEPQWREWMNAHFPMEQVSPGS